MPTTLITGATDGIGHMLAKLYAARQDRLVLVGRRALDALSDPLFTEDNYARADLSYPASAANTIKQFLDAYQIKTVDLLIHNAGLGYYGPVAGQPPENIAALVDVNYTAPVLLTHTLIPYLRGGKVAFVSSVATAMPTPDYAVYTATKAALDGFAHNLRMELAPEDIEVALLHPGATRTGMHKKANMPGDTRKYASAAEVAAAIQRALDTEAEQTTIGFVNRALRLVGTSFPGLIDRAMTRSAS